MRRRSLTLVVVAGLLATACSAGSTRPHAVAPGRALDWRSCGAHALQCATLVVPLDPSAPHGETVHLALYRHRATGHRIGSLVTNPGGPGVSGRFLAADAQALFPSQVVEHFDIVAWDPRGVGASTAIRCGERLDAFYAAPRPPHDGRETDANVTAARALAAACARGSGALLAHVATRDDVRDLDAIRAALGDDRLTYLGFSYGTYIGARYAATYATHVRAMVLDGAVDPALSVAASTVQQSTSFDRDLAAFLAECSADAKCAFHSGGDATAGLHRLLAQIAAEPEFAHDGKRSRTVGSTEAVLGIAYALYGGREQWPDLADALRSAATGDATKLAALSDGYTDRHPGGVYDTSTEAYYAKSCLDGQGPSSLTDVQRIAHDSAATAPFLGPASAWLGLPCAFWPARPVDGPAPLTPPSGLPTVVVVAATRDPATPHAWGVALARDLGARLVTADADTHTAFLTSGPCVQRPVVDYLVTAQTPPADVTC